MSHWGWLIDILNLKESKRMKGLGSHTSLRQSEAVLIGNICPRGPLPRRYWTRMSIEVI